MYRYILFIAFAIGSLSLNAQQDLSLHFMDNIIQSGQTNPAIMSKYRINIALPSLYGNIYNSQFSPNQIFTENGNTLTFSPSKLLNQLDDENNLIQGNLEVQTFAASVRLAKVQFTVSHALKSSFHFGYPKGVVDLLWNGNAPFIDKTVNVAPSIDALAYQEIGLGVTLLAGKLFTVGGRLKYLIGMSNISTANSSATIYTDPKFYQLTAETDFVLNTSGFEIDGDQVDFVGGSANEILFANNRGFAFDLGATLNLTDKLSFKASILDIGKINWEENVTNQTSQGTYTFDGFDLEPIIDDEDYEYDSVLDTLEQIFDFKETKNKYSTTLPKKFYLSGTFSPIKSVRLGALIYGEHYRSRLYPSLALSAQKDFGKVLSLGAVYAIRNNTFNNLGLNCTLRFVGIQLFAMTDNVLPLFNLMNAQNTNFRFGMNIAFGKE